MKNSSARVRRSHVAAILRSKPEEAIDRFKRTRMDVLAIGSYLVTKTEN